MQSGIVNFSAFPLDTWFVVFNKKNRAVEVHLKKKRR